MFLGTVTYQSQRPDTVEFQTELLQHDNIQALIAALAATIAPVSACPAKVISVTICHSPTKE